MKEGWKEVRLGEVCFPTNNINWKNNTNSFKYIDLTSVSISEHKVSEALVLIDSNNAPSRAKQIVKNGDILFGTTRPTLCRYCLITPELDNQICSTGFCVLRPNTKDILSKYLFYVFSFHEIYSYLEPLQKGANYPAVTNKNVFDYTFPLPPLPEQQRIVSVLDSAFAKIEQMKRNAEKALLDAQDIYKNTLDDMMKMKEGWEEKRLKDIGKIITGQTPSTMNKEYYGGDIPFVKPADINIDGNGRINIETECLTEEGCAKSRFVELDSVLMVCIGGTIGKTGFTSKHKIAFNQQINAITDIKDNEMKFIYYCMISSDFQSKVISGGKSAQATLPIINKSKWENLSIPIPPVSEQQRIVSVLDDLSDMCKKLEIFYQRVVADCEEMKQAILTRAMNGEL